MADNSKIEWTDASWNPIRARLTRKVGTKAQNALGWHCEHATTGCAGCYAEAMNIRLGTGLPFKPGHLDNGDVEMLLDESMLTWPLRWKKPRTIFVGSMTDLFGRFVTDAMLDRIFAVMALCPQHTLQVLTKRSDRMRSYFAAPDLFARLHCAIHAVADYDAPEHAARAFAMISYLKHGNGNLWPLPNVWLGVSTERQEEADARIPDLLATPAAVRFISAEPLLGPIDLTAIHREDPKPPHNSWKESALHGCVHPWRQGQSLDDLAGATPRLDWVIAGGESGPHARPMHPDWARSLRDQCQAAGVAFFMKQWGEWLPWEPEHGPCWLSQNGRSEDSHALFPAEFDGNRNWDDGLWAADEATHATFQRVGKKAAGRLLDGVEHNGMPERSA